MKHLSPIFYSLLLMSCTLLYAQKIPKVEALLKKMTLEEKIGQLNLLGLTGGVATGETVSKNVAEKIKSGRVGGLFGSSDPKRIREAQRIAVKKTRLKIPLLIGSDIIHGYKTIFPIPLGIASSWDMDLIKKSAQIAAKEATADGINWNFSPMVDIARDPRWGRICEGAGEDPFLGSAIAKSMVEGYQGKSLSNKETMLSCVKHFALYGAAESGRDYNSVSMSKVKMFNQYLPPYKAAIDAGVGSVMSSFNDVDAIPASGNKWLLTDLLRKMWGFQGFVVSDYTAVNEMIPHGLGDLKTVSALALNAGLDMDMIGEGFLTTLKESIADGSVSEASVTKACRLILEAKYKLGLFDNPYLYQDKKRLKKDILTKKNIAFSRKIAAHSFVLLKNHNHTLPLRKTSKIALIGPLANDKNNMLGAWAPTGNSQISVPIFEGIKNVSPNTEILYAKGANISDDPIFAKKINIFGKRIDIDSRTPEEMIKEALEIAKVSDIIVAVMGEASEMSGEDASRSNISLPSSQKTLIQALSKLGKPLVIVLMTGRPLDISEEMELPVSILNIWFPGIEAGNAVADVLFGGYNPSGKITASWPRNVGQIPVYHSMKRTGRPQDKDAFSKFKSNFLDVSNTPLLPFGYGLSYTTFEYSDLKVNKSKITTQETIIVSITLSNTGDFDGEEVVQLYLKDIVRSITPPNKTLKGFKKIFLKKGEHKTVNFSLRPEDLKFYNQYLDFVSEPGEFEVFVGGDSTTSLKASFTLVEK